MSEIQILAATTVKPENKEAFLALMKEVVKASRAEAGCVRYDLAQELQNPLALTVVETWASQAAIDEHNATPHFKKLVDFLTANKQDIDIKLLKQII